MTVRMTKPRPRWTTSWRLITLDEAAYVLAEWNDDNRPQKPSALKDVRDAVHRNGWRSLDPVKFAGKFGESRMLDGQHRLAVLIETGEAQWVQVTENVPDDSFDDLDTNSVREPRDILSIVAGRMGVKIKNVSTVSALIKAQHFYSRTGVTSLKQNGGKLPNSLYGKRLMEDYARLSSLAERGRAMATRLGAGASATMCALFLDLAEGTTDPESVVVFERAITSGKTVRDQDWEEEAAGYRLGSPERSLWNHFDAVRQASNGTGSRLLSKYRQMWALFTAYDYFMQGTEPCPEIRYKRTTPNEPAIPMLGEPRGKMAA